MDEIEISKCKNYAIIKNNYNVNKYKVIKRTVTVVVVCVYN